MKAHIRVTAKDIAAGAPGDPRCCPVALAIKRLLRDGVYVSVGEDDLLTIGDNRHTYDTACSASVVEFVGRFDGDMPVKPFRFTIDVPRKYLKEGK